MDLLCGQVTREAKERAPTLILPTPKWHNISIYLVSHEAEKLHPTVDVHVCFRKKDFEPMLLQSEYHTIKSPTSTSL